MKKIILPLFFLINICYAQINLTQGLVGYYPFNGNANDLSGNNNNPTFNNATLTTDKAGIANGAYYFDGSSSYMQIPNNSSLQPQEITLYAVVKPTGFYHGLCYNNCIIDKGDLDRQDGNYSLRFTQAQYTNGDCNIDDSLHQDFVGYSGISNPSAPLYTPYVQKDTWYCLAYTVSADSVKMYVNGILKHKAAKGTGIGTNTYNLAFGRKITNLGYPYWYKGIIDEIRIYNRAINSDEVNALCALFTTPVTLTNFKATSLNNKSTSLTWQCAQETNIKNYTIERSTNSMTDFVPIAEINALNNGTGNTYTFSDNNIVANINYYYRIVINETDGTKKYSDINRSGIVSHNSLVAVYPNPSKGNFNVVINQNIGAAKISVINNLGQTVLSRKITGANNSNTIPLNLYSQPKGTYWIKIYSNKNISVNKIVKQ